MPSRCFFPEALIDKLIGDSVMALYVPMLAGLKDPQRLMLRQAQELLRRVESDRPESPVLEVGIGMDFGEAFVGNIGDRWLYDFTAVGDVVNTAFRLQADARSGEILMSARLAEALGDVEGESVEVSVQGKAQPVRARRLRIGPNPGASPT